MPERNIKEDEIYRLAVEAFKKNVPGEVEFETLALEPLDTFGFRPDRLLRLFIEGRKLHYYAEIKTAVTKTQKNLLLVYREKLKHPLLLITKYVNPEIAEELKQDEIEFIDAAGNAFVNQPPLYIFIKGNRLPETLRGAHPKRAFKTTGLKIIYVFLCSCHVIEKLLYL